MWWLWPVPVFWFTPLPLACKTKKYDVLVQQAWLTVKRNCLPETESLEVGEWIDVAEAGHMLQVVITDRTCSSFDEYVKTQLFELEGDLIIRGFVYIRLRPVIEARSAMMTMIVMQNQQLSHCVD